MSAIFDPPTEIDLHVHTIESPCGYLTPAQVVAIARANQRKVIAVTDHDTTAGAIAVRDLVAQTGDDILVLVGMELSTRDCGHVLVFGSGIERDWDWRRGDPMPTRLPDDWVAIKAHPFREVVKHAPPGPIVDELPDLPASIDAVEIWNGNDLLVKATGRVADLDAASRAYASRRGKVAVAASDAHRATSLHAYHTLFPRPVRSVTDVVEQIKQGEVRPGSMPDAELDARRIAWQRRRVVGWHVDRLNVEAHASQAGLDTSACAEVVANFLGVRELTRSGASLETIRRDTGLDPVTAADFVAIVREEAITPKRVR